MEGWGSVCAADGPSHPLSLFAVRSFVAVLHPELFSWVDGAVRVASDAGVLRGRSLLDDSGRSWQGPNAWTGRPTCRVAVDLDAPAVLRLITEGLSAK